MVNIINLLPALRLLKVIVVVAVFFTFVNNLHAEVIYRHADTILYSPNINDTRYFYLDMDKDGEDDFVFYQAIQGSMDWIVCEIYSAQFDYGKEVLVEDYQYYDSPILFDKGVAISAISERWHDSYQEGMGITSLYLWGGEQGATDKYIAVRFKKNTSYCYGWVRVSIEAGFTSMTVHDYAYESAPGVGITTGDKGESGVNDDRFSILNCTFKNGILNIENNTQSWDATIFDLSVSTIRAFTVDFATENIDLCNLNEGVYILWFRNSKYSIINKLFIIK